ncbi:hypothetical protein JW964_22650 [candidate division KSB1 bacterium]|nr:hypothetical protein [candidate division KSB1 bacterium]
MKNNLIELKERILLLKKINISHENLGPENGFHEAQKTKDEICEYLITLLENTEKLFNNSNKIVLNFYYKHVEQFSNEINGHNSSIDEITKKGIHNQSFPTEREQIIVGLINTQKKIHERLLEYELYLRILSIETSLQSYNSLSQISKDTENYLSEISKNAEESQKILNNLQTQIMEKGIRESKGTFNQLKNNHAKREFWWFLSAIGFALIFLILIIITYFYNPNFDNTKVLAIYFIRKIFLISTIAIFFKISLNRYNLERNLRVIYDHRSIVLEQYHNFENAIGDDTDSKNKFRLEIAKFIFSDPQTGYIKDGQVNEISVNPIVNIAEKIAEKI